MKITSENLDSVEKAFQSLVDWSEFVDSRLCEKGKGFNRQGKDGDVIENAKAWLKVVSHLRRQVALDELCSESQNLKLY